ncbi:MAG TPA: tRNA pseudouridine(38-40) synthase TruA [Terriglobales bacterium]|jgi:tRNA pseudouridine38-40 synthase
MSEPRTVRLHLSYDGSDYHGWQVQPGLATIQQEVQTALALTVGEQVVVHGSGRTDAGVHALGQVAHVVLHQARLPCANLAKALNARLPPSIRILEARDAPVGFHARHLARSKLYRYRIYREPVASPFLRRYTWHYPYPLNEAAVIAAAPAFTGRHDFRSFTATPERGAPPLGDTVREVFRSEFVRNASELVYEIEGQGFLHHMVRNLVGFLIEIGRGARRAEEIPFVLAARRRAAAGPTAPAAGLYLVAVQY